MRIGGIALVRAIPKGRVWSFPSNIKLAKFADGGYATSPKRWIVGETSIDFPLPRVADIVNKCMDDLRRDIIVVTSVQIRYFDFGENAQTNLGAALASDI